MFARWLVSACISTTLSFGLVRQAQAQLTSNVFSRVLMIRPAGASFLGTGFTLEVDGRQYLITARHVVTGMKAEDTLEVMRGGRWRQLKVRVFRCDDPVDIAVVVPPVQLTAALPLEPTMNGIAYAQEVYFAGFPYGLSTVAPLVTGELPLAFVKRGILSATEGDQASLLYLDGENNPGFSGGPIVFRDLSRQAVTFKLAGVISGYRPEFTPVLKPEEIAAEQVTPEDEVQGRISVRDGHVFRLTDTGEVAQTNTGIVIGYNIRHALDVIAKNPIGPEVKK